MLRYLNAAFITAGFVLGAAAQAQMAPSSFANDRNGLVTQTLGGTCYSFNVAADSLPCNPAFAAKQEGHEFKINFFGGNNISHLNDAVALVRGSGQASNVQNFFAAPSNSQFDANLEAAYLGENIGFAYEPFRVSYLSSIRNPALPQITLFASLENSLRLQLASLAVEDVYLGLQVHYLDRQVIASRFFLTDLVAENGSSFLAAQEQQFYFLEPGILYQPQSDFWHPQLTFNLINWGLHVNGNTMTDPLPETHLGAAIFPEMSWGVWGLALDSAWSQRVVKPEDAFTLGTSYQIGILKTYGSISTNSNGLGFTVLYDHFNLGLSYTNTQEYLDSIEAVTNRRMYFLIGGEM